jgi:hypothetical protein
LELIVLVIALALALGNSASDLPATSTFDDQAFCAQMRASAARDDTRPGTIIDRTTTHGGVFVDCDRRLVDMRTMLGRPVTKAWLRAQQRYWGDDMCAEPAVSEATSNGWKVTATIVANGKTIAIFQARCPDVSR